MSKKRVDKMWRLWRVNHWLWIHHLKPLATLGRFVIRVVCSADIPPQMIIGEGTVFPHMGLGSLFHPNVVIGKECVILHGVTIGGKSGQAGFPQIGKNVLIGAHALILGDIRIGDGAIIGAGAVVTHNVPNNAVVVGNPAKIIKYRTDTSA